MSYTIKSDKFNKSGILFIFFPIILIFLLEIYPFSMSIYYSLTKFDGFSKPVFIGLENYINLFKNETFFGSIKNNTILALVSPIFIIIPLILAVILFQNKGRFLKISRFTILLPYCVSMTIVGIIFRAFLQYSGPLNDLLNKMGLSFLAIDWLNNIKTAFPLIILATFWRDFGMYTVIYIAALSNLDKDLLDAAKVDGATWFQEFRHIIIPSLNPIIVFIGALVLIGDYRNMFDYVYNITRGGPGFATHTIEFMLYREGFHYLNMGLACAIGVIMFIIIFVLSYLQIKIMTRKE